MLIRLDGIPLDREERALVFANQAVTHTANTIEFGARESFRLIRSECVTICIKALCEIESQTAEALLNDYSVADIEYRKAVLKARGMWQDHRKEETHKEVVRLLALRYALRLELLFRLQVADTALEYTSILVDVQDTVFPARRLIVNKPVWPFLDKITRVVRLRRVRPDDTRTFVEPVKQKKTRKRKKKLTLNPELIEREAVADEAAVATPSSPYRIITSSEIDDMVARAAGIQEVPQLVPSEEGEAQSDQPEFRSYATDGTNDDGYPNEE